MQDGSFFNEKRFTLRLEGGKCEYEGRYINLKDLELFLEVPLTAGECMHSEKSTLWSKKHNLMTSLNIRPEIREMPLQGCIKLTYKQKVSRDQGTLQIDILVMSSENNPFFFP